MKFTTPKRSANQFKALFLRTGTEMAQNDVSWTKPMSFSARRPGYDGHVQVYMSQESTLWITKH